MKPMTLHTAMSQLYCHRYRAWVQSDRAYMLSEVLVNRTTATGDTKNICDKEGLGLEVLAGIFTCLAQGLSADTVAMTGGTLITGDLGRLQGGIKLLLTRAFEADPNEGTRGIALARMRAVM